MTEGVTDISREVFGLHMFIFWIIWTGRCSGKMADEMDLVVWSQFKMSIGDTVEGSVDIVYPYGALKPIRDLLRSRVQTGDDDDASASEWSQQLKTASGDAKLDINVTLANINGISIK